MDSRLLDVLALSYLVCQNGSIILFMDLSELDKRYFVTHDTYNCPFCHRGSISYTVTNSFEFDWSNERAVHGYLVSCAGCQSTSLHLSNYRFYNIQQSGFWNFYDDDGDQTTIERIDKELDDLFFYHQPTSFFTVDSRVPLVIRNLMNEADGCLKLNYLVGGSGALRKAIYELIKDQQAIGDSYQNKIKSLKQKYLYIYGGYFDILANVQDMTSENLHEQDGSWEPWDSKDLRLFITTVKEVLYEIYVTPDQKAQAKDAVMKLKSRSSLKEATASKKASEESIEATD